MESNVISKNSMVLSKRCPIYKGRSEMPFDHKKYDKHECLSRLERGVKATKYVRFGRPHQRIFYMLKSNANLLLWRSPNKSPEKSSLTIDHIWKIQLGQASKSLAQRYDPSLEDKTMSLYYKKTKSLDLAFDSVMDLEIFLCTVMYMIEELRKALQSAKQMESRNCNIVWSTADTDMSGSLSYAESKGLLKTLGYHVSRKRMKALFLEFDQDKNGVIDRNEFQKLINKLFYKQEISHLFLRYADITFNEPLIFLDKFKQFLEIEQRMSLSAEEIIEIMQELTVEELDMQNPAINFQDFSRYIFSASLNNALCPSLTEETMDMTQPLPHYFVESSHNTYLSGHQMRGESSYDMYANVLLSGCRCVELDIWNGPEGEPKITHGHTWVSNTGLRDVAVTILTSAFTATPYPLILSLENHCSQKQQDRLASIFTEVFGDHLHVPEGELKSPHELKHKILIKAKKSSASEELQKIIALEGNKELFGERVFNSIPSRTETKLVKVMKQFGIQALVDLHKKHLIRVYPAGKHFGSSNYDPVIYWFMGCQIVALNYQTADIGLVLNRGFFYQNGSSGYVLKPEFLRNSEIFDIEGRKPVMKLTVEVISGQNVPKKKDRLFTDSFVKLAIHGIPDDCQTVKTSVVKDNGLNPIWNYSFSFDIRVMEITMLSISLYGNRWLRTTSLGKCAIPLTAIRTGYRAIQLFDEYNQVIVNSLILCKFQFEPYNHDLN